MSKIAFQTNVPVEVALRDTTGQTVPSQYGNGSQVKFETTDGRVFYVADTVGLVLHQQINDLGVQPGDVITIVKAEVDHGRGQKRIRWMVKSELPRTPRRSQPIAPRPSPGPQAAAAPAPRPAAAKELTLATPGNGAELLLAQTKMLIDVYAQAAKHAAQYEGLIKPETVQSALITAFINLSKGAAL